MAPHIRPHLFACASAALALAAAATVTAFAAETPLPMDLAEVLRLAGARSIDIEIAKEETRLARAESKQANERFFPWLAPGFGYRRHEGALADVQGLVTDIDKESYDAGATLHAQVDLGDALFASRAARQRVAATERRLDATAQDAVLEAVSRYLDLLLAQVNVDVFRQAETVSAEYGTQLARAVEAGVASRAEELRVEVQTARNRFAREEAEEEALVASARLAQVLRVDPAATIVASRDDVAAVTLVPTELPLDALLTHALASRGEVLENEARVAAAGEGRKGAVYGPLIPTVGVEVSAGSLGGGPDGARDDQDGFLDQTAGLRWRIGPGGLFDFGRIDAADARLRRVELEGTRLRDVVSREVVEARARALALARRTATASAALATSERAFALSRERRELGIDVVLENIQAEQELTRTRGDYLATVVEATRAQYRLLRALGGSTPP